MGYIDSHAHYTSGRFNRDRAEVLKKVFENGVDKVIECGTNTQYINKVLKLANEYDNIYTVIGYFPTDTPELELPGIFENYVSLLDNKKVLGIGEIGLDYYHKSDIEIQKKWFIKQLKLAKDMGLPVCIHSREAEQDTLNILKNNGKTVGVIHCYSYGYKTMKELLKLGYYFGVGGTSTYLKNNLTREAIKAMPLDRILLETDAPYLTPEPYRRDRNDSTYIKFVIKELAKLKGVSEDEIIKKTNDNVEKVYPKIK